MLLKHAPARLTMPLMPPHLATLLRSMTVYAGTSDAGFLPAKLASWKFGPPLGPNGHRLLSLESAGPNTYPAAAAAAAGECEASLVEEASPRDQCPLCSTHPATAALQR